MLQLRQYIIIVFFIMTEQIKSHKENLKNPPKSAEKQKGILAQKLSSETLLWLLELGVEIEWNSLHFQNQQIVTLSEWNNIEVSQWAWGFTQISSGKDHISLHRWLKKVYFNGNDMSVIAENRPLDNIPGITNSELEKFWSKLLWRKLILPNGKKVILDSDIEKLWIMYPTPNEQLKIVATKKWWDVQNITLSKDGMKLYLFIEEKWKTKRYITCEYTPT